MSEEKLWVVIPVYNEEKNVFRVVEQWLPGLSATRAELVLCLINDGSTDKTQDILNRMEPLLPNIKIVEKTNSGHGQTCLLGYRLALENKADWIFQIDSDGQCDPAFFETFWKARKEHPVIYGYRKKRDDGVVRFLISRVVSLTALIATGTWVKDANVPYRLMRADTVAPFINEIPKEMNLANVQLAILQKRQFGIHWINIHFRERLSGSSGVKGLAFAKRGLDLFHQLRESEESFIR